MTVTRARASEDNTNLLLGGVLGHTQRLDVAIEIVVGGVMLLRDFVGGDGLFVDLLVTHVVIID